MTSKRDQLGASSSFARAGQARSMRRQLTDAAFGGGDPSVLALDLISANPDNPRENIGDISGMASSLQEIGQIQAITVASVEAYLRDRPERASDLDAGAEYVVVDGHRRLAGAREAGLPSIKVTVDDARVSTDEALLEAAFVANAQRENLSDLEEAQALETLVAFYGSQHKAAKRLGVTQPYISQRLSLLKLEPELQADLEAGRRKVEHVRGLATLSPEEQRATADARAQQAKQQAEEKKQRRQAAQAKRPTDNGVITGHGASAPTSPVSPGDNAVITPRGASGVPGGARAGDNDVITPPKHEAAAKDGQSDNDVISCGQEGDPAVAHLPWHNPQALNRLAREHMTAEDRNTLAKLLAQD